MTSRLDLDGAAFVHPSAQMYGHVRMLEGSSIWCNSVVRSEAAHVEIGRFTNVQDFVMIHTDPGRPVVVGDYCSITHHATLHGCTIGDGSLIGIQAVVLNNAKIGKNCLVGAGSVVTEGKEFPDNALIIGSPAKVVRIMSDEQIERLHYAARHYQENGPRFAKGLKKLKD